ncbi:hypothetical protein HS088_TW05G00437 [Tripterygium wilfordii]|uniref:Protein kinase domain-containing protein n=1 Tax=Tripterygium wilfordii TaxID=458696 RepID=A0A7J7DMW6_TRIWF|nr:probable serine/threonine-protein kinase PBL20 [Tripterygium wilfordii]KAF5747710.1 hypothetical protein HS088_TW05G00437 [Tripterygium wilfordii]
MAFRDVALEELLKLLPNALLMGQGASDSIDDRAIPANSSQITTVAIRVLDRESGHAELQWLSRLENHPNIIPFTGRCTTRDRVYLVSEYFNNVTFYDRLTEDLTWRQVLRVIAGVASGLAHIHAAGLVHRDIKPQSVIVNQDFHPTIVDLNLICQEGEITDVQGPTYGYFSKEDVNEGIAKPSQDMYAFGIFILQAVMRRQQVFSTQTPVVVPHILDSMQTAMTKRGHAVDERLMMRGCSPSQAKKVTTVALQCVQVVNARPTSTQVEKELKKELKVLTILHV